MTDTKYNGYRNYETWLANLWLTNEESFNDFKNNVKGCSVGETALVLKDYLDYLLEAGSADLGYGFLEDLLASAIQKIDCFELAENFLED